MSTSTTDLLLSRRSVLAIKMREPGPTDKDLDIILRAAIRVPDHGRIEPWRIQVIRKPAQKRLGELYAELYTRDNPDASDKQIEVERHKPQRAPVLLVVSAHPDPERFEKIPRIEQLMSCGAACQNMLIAAEALGYAAQWITGWPAYHPGVRRALGHGADTDIVGFIYLGSRPEEPPKERPRPVFEDIVSHWDGG